MDWTDSDWQRERSETRQRDQSSGALNPAQLAAYAEHLMDSGRFAEAAGLLFNASEKFPEDEEIELLLFKVPILAHEFQDREQELDDSARTLHPVFDFTNEVVIFGFNETRMAADMEKPATEKIRLVGTTGGISLQGDGPLVRTDSRDILLDTRYEAPPALEDEWSRSDLDQFRESGLTLAGQSLYRGLREAIDRHIHLLDEGSSVILATWPVLSFVYPTFPAIPFILLLGPKNTGKTQVLQVLEKLCRCGHRSRGTAASLGDLVQSRRVTWLIDQANKLPENLLQELTDSYKRGSKRTVTDTDHRGQPHEFDTYGPKAFAAHRQFDEDLLDRCIQIGMVPAGRELEPLLARDNRLDRLRWKLYRYSATNFSRFFRTRAFRSRDELGADLHLFGREWELWWPMEVLFEWLDVPIEDREAARDFYRGSIPSTKAELPETERAVLDALLELDDGQCGQLVTNTKELVPMVREAVAGHPSPESVGLALTEFGLVTDKRRPRVEGRKVTEWTINAERLRRLATSWEICREAYA